MKRIYTPKETIRNFRPFIIDSIVVILIGIIIVFIERFVPFERFHRLYDAEITVGRIEEREVYKSGYRNVYTDYEYYIISDDNKDYLILDDDNIDEIYGNLTKGTVAKISHGDVNLSGSIPLYRAVVNGKNLAEYDPTENDGKVTVGIVVIIIGILISTPVIVDLIKNEIARKKREDKKKKKQINEKNA